MTNNTLKRAAELMRSDALSMHEMHKDGGDDRANWLANKEFNERMKLADELERMAQVEPVTAQSKLHGDQVWSPCGIGHHSFVQENKSEWPGYDTRLLYAGPQEPVNQQLLAEFEQCQFELGELAATEADDIDSDTFEIIGEDEQGRGGCAYVSIVELAGRAAHLLSNITAAQLTEPSEDTKNSALLLQAATDICTLTGQPVSDFAKWLSDGGMLDLIEAWSESIEAKNSGVAINSEMISQHHDAELVAAADNAFRYIACASGMDLQYGLLSTSVSAAMLAGALAKYKTKEGQEADGAIVSSIASAHSIQKCGAL